MSEVLHLCLDLNIWCAALLADKKNVLVTANFKDFISIRDTQLLKQDRHAIYYRADHRLHIVHPYLMAEWLKLPLFPAL
jgi:hypothetical protein